MNPLTTSIWSGAAPSFATGRLWLFPLVAATLLIGHWATAFADRPAAAAIAALLILVIGIPHGALDIEIAARRIGSATRAGRCGILAVYLSGAAAMALLWWMQPVAALLCFLAISVIHFSEDWDAAGEPFLMTMAGWSVLAVPALAHMDAVAAIFSLLVGSADGASVAYLLACTAPPAALCSLVVLYNAVRAGRWQLASALATALVAAVLLPPLVSFALYFCLFHTPMHMAGAWRASAHLSRGRRSGVTAAVSALAFGLAALLYNHIAAAPISDNAVTTTFIILSVLTLPHFLMEALMRRKAPMH